MTKKLLALLLACMLVLVSCACIAVAEGETNDPDPTVGSEPAGDGDGDEPAAPVVVTLKANTGEGDDVVLEPDAEGNVTLPECPFTKNNFRFTGWNTHDDESGDSYKPGDSITITEATNVYAIWVYGDVELKYYKVTYDANGGEGETVDDSEYIENGIVVVMDNEFTREGYLFKCWNTKADGSGESYEPPFDEFDILEDVTLYAIWEEDPDYVPPVVDDPEPSEPSEPESEVTETEPVVTETDNPKTGEAATGAVAAALAAVALGAFVLMKKKEN